MFQPTTGRYKQDDLSSSLKDFMKLHEIALVEKVKYAGDC